MNKKYMVRLSDEERRVCQDIIKHLKGSSQKFRRAQILLQAGKKPVGQVGNCQVLLQRCASQLANGGALVPANSMD